MLQPFEQLTTVYVKQIRKLGKKYLVTQGYNYAGLDGINNIYRSIIVSAYGDLGLAKTHWNAVKEDRYAAILHLEKEDHFNKILQLVGGTDYEVYWAVVKSALQLEKRINLKYKEHLRRYIEHNTNWRISHDASIHPQIQLIFGMLYIIIKHGAQTIRVPFTEIERS